MEMTVNIAMCFMHVPQGQTNKKAGSSVPV